MRRYFYRLAKRYLSDARFKQLSRIKQRLFGVSWVVSPASEGAQAGEGLRAILQQFLDVGSSEAVLVHSSAAQLAKIGLDASRVIQLLEEMVLPEGTLLMPSFPFGQSFYDFIKTNPVFKVNRTPSRMGLVTEVFRRSPGVLRSLHPTHAVCAKGKTASWYVSEHHLDETPFGLHSPFARLAERGGLVVGLGLQPDFCLTSVHVVEDRLGRAYPLRLYGDECYQVAVIDQNGDSVHREIPVHDQALSRVRDVSILIDALKAKQRITLAKYRSLECFMVSAQDIDQTLLELLQAGITIYRTEHTPFGS